MTTIASQITSLAVVYSIVYSDAHQKKHQSSASLAFVWGIHRDRWIPRTKGQLRGKCFHLMTSSWAKRLASWRLLVFNDSKCHLFAGGLPQKGPVRWKGCPRHDAFIHVLSNPWDLKRAELHFTLINSYPGQNVRHFADNVFVNGKFCILIKMSVKFVPNGPIDNRPALV